MDSSYKILITDIDNALSFHYVMYLLTPRANPSQPIKLSNSLKLTLIEGHLSAIRWVIKTFIKHF